MSTCVLVLSAPRSGSSMVAGLLRQLGVHMGQRFRPADGCNARGYWEDLDFQEVAFALMECPFLVDPPRFEPTEGVRAALAELATERCRRPVWGVKLVRLHWLLPHLRAALPPGSDIRLVECRRDLAAVVRSKMGSWLIPADVALASAKAWRESVAEAAVAGMDLPRLVVPYEEALADPAGWTQRLADFAGVSVTPAARAWIDPTLCHFAP